MYIVFLFIGAIFISAGLGTWFSVRDDLMDDQTPYGWVEEHDMTVEERHTALIYDTLARISNIMLEQDEVVKQRDRLNDKYD